MNPPSDIKNYKLKDREVKYLRPKHNHETGEFLGIYKAIGFLVVCFVAQCSIDTHK